LSQEIIRFNKLLKRIRFTLDQIQQAIVGTVVMSAELDLMYKSLFNNVVPTLWEEVAPDSLKPLGAWIIDLHQRLEFLNKWILEGPPQSYWINAFFFPQGFLTGVLQNHARKHHVAIDGLQFQFEVLKMTDPTKVTAGPENGVYVDGLFIDGAAWDTKEESLCDASLGELFTEMPILHFLPNNNIVRNPKDYECPVYKTHVRAGVLSTTGISTNLVVSVFIPTSRRPEAWVLRGTALLCQLSY